MNTIFSAPSAASSTSSSSSLFVAWTDAAAGGATLNTKHIRSHLRRHHHRQRSRAEDYPCRKLSSSTTRTRASSSSDDTNTDTTSSSSSSSWTAREKTQMNKNIDYLYELGKNDTGNTNTNVGAKEGKIDDIFARNRGDGEFKLGADSDIANGDLRFRFQEVRQFNNLVGDYFVPEQFIEKVALHVCKNFMCAAQPNSPNVPLILGVWGGKGCGKTFNLELACKKLGMMPIVTSAGELEDESAGGPGRLIRQRYRRAGEVVRVHGKMSCLIVNDIDAGLGRFKDTQQTVNNQTVCGTLMNLCDHPELVSLGEERREDGSNLQTVRIPIIVTGNDLSRLYAPLLRDGRMEKWYWDPQFDDIVNMVDALFKDDPLWTIDDTRALVAKFPNQPLDFFGATRSAVYDDAIRNWMIGNSKKKNGYDDQFGQVLMRNLALGTSGVDLFGNVGTDEAPSSAWKYHAPLEIVQSEKTQITTESVMAAAKELSNQQDLVNSEKLSVEYMKWQKNSEDLTPEEKEAMEAKRSWQKTMKKREHERELRRMEMRSSAASEQALKARKLMLEATIQRAKEKKAQREAEIAANPSLKLEEAARKMNSEVAKKQNAIPGPPSRKDSKYTIVSVESAFDAFKAKMCKVVDVRDMRSFRRESVVGSINLPIVKVEGKPLAYTYEANAADFIEQFTKMFTNNEEMIVLLGGDTIDERTNLEIDNPELNGLAAYLAENIGYENIAVVPGGYDGWVREYTPGGKKRLKEWSLDYVTGAAGTTCVGAELPVVGSLADERRAAELEKLEKLKKSLASGDAWKRAFDPRSGRMYFYHNKSKRTQNQNPEMYNAKTGRWKLLDPLGENEKEDEEEECGEGITNEDDRGSNAKVDIKTITIDEAVERFYSKKAVLIDCRNAFDIKTESIEKMLTCPLRLAKGTKLSPEYDPVEEKDYIESLLTLLGGGGDATEVKAQTIIFVGGDSEEEQSHIAASRALLNGFENVEIVDGSVSKWLKFYSPSGKKKKVVAGGAYKTDLLATGAFNPFAGES